MRTPKRLSSDKQDYVVRRLCEKIDSLYRFAAEDRRPAEAINQKIATFIYGDHEYSLLSQQRRAFLRGYMESARKHHNALTHWRVMFGGELIPGESVPSGRWNEVSTGNFVYNDDPTKIYS